MKKVKECLVRKSRAFALNLFYYLFRWTNWFKNLPRRMYVTSIGLTGHVSLLDKEQAKEEKLKPLNRFEKWLCQDIIRAEQKTRQETFRQVCLEELGEEIG